jgi:hypothetical protein
MPLKARAGTSLVYFFSPQPKNKGCFDIRQIQMHVKLGTVM